MTGDNVTEKRREETNNAITSNLVDDSSKFALQIQLDNICRILGGEATHYICTDKKTQHQKIVIEYDHKNK